MDKGKGNIEKKAKGKMRGKEAHLATVVVQVEGDLVSCSFVQHGTTREGDGVDSCGKVQQFTRAGKF